ncbi:MAG: IS30 family transposase [Peptoniphilaceae bacterium]|nr:IS30 family transposase [Peptoniphilaceae bacterium]MDY3075231.1 IS30 family transposase [Peptoniphilaceae bacterium]
MDHLYSNTTEHRKGQHLSFEHRVLIQTRLKDGWSANKIAKEIGCAPNTARNEIRRETVALYKGNILRYKATTGQATYEKNRQVCCRHCDFLEKADFISFVEKKFFEDGWSLDACVGYALKEGLFLRRQIVCTKTLYGYVDLGLLGIKNIDLPERLRRSPKKEQTRKKSGFLDAASKNDRRKQMTAASSGTGRQILSSVPREKDDDALLTMIERKTRKHCMIRVPGQDPNGVMACLETIRSQYSEHWDDIFKTVTTDNGSEFSLLFGLEDVKKTLVYFAHPYTSYEKGSVERHNGLIRRFIPKGKRIDNYSDEQIAQIET